MEFTILERIILQGLLPQEGDYITFGIIKGLRTELSFSEKEIKDFEIKQDGKSITWDSKKERVKKVEVGEKAQSIISEALKKLNDEKKINEQNVSLYERFVLTIKT